MEQIDVLSLRGALRLTQSIQKERSATCCFLISKRGDITNSPPMSEMFSYDHKISNTAMTQYRQYRDKESSHNISKGLQSARGMLENEGNAVKLADESSKRGFVSVVLANTFQNMLSDYNEVIETLLKNNVFKYRPVPTEIRGLPRQHSSPMNLIDTISSGVETKNVDLSSLLHSFAAHRSLSKYTKSLMKAEGPRNKEVRSAEDQRVVSLFCILINVLRLKESSHIKNMIFMQLLESSNDSIVQVIINYLIMHIAEETSMIVTIQELAKDLTHSLFSSDYLQPGEKLSSLIQLVLNDLNLAAFQKAVSVEEFLKLSCTYHDRLYSMELVTLEQIESCQYLSSKVKPLRNPNLSPNGVSQAVTSFMALLASKADNTEDKKNITKVINDIPAEELKEMFLSMMDDNNGLKRVKMARRKSHNIRFNEKSVSNRSNRSNPSVALLGSKLSKEKSTSMSRSQLTGSVSQKLKIEKAEASYLPELEPVIAEWHVALEEINFRKKIGSGSAGTTYLARWRREEVAVKVATATSLGILSWNMELRALQKLHHPNIIRMMGCIFTETPFAMSLILEYCNLGDLGRALNNPTPPNFFGAVVMGLSTGLEYLHSKGIIHRDVKPENILIHGKMETCDISVKLIDFGLSTTFKVPKHLRNLDDSIHSTFSAGSGSSGSEEVEDHTAEAGTYRWMAPEVIRHESYDFKIDVYSFGVVLWQLLTREKPFHNNTQEEAAKLVALGYQRPPFPRGVPKPVMSVIDTAWEEDPDDRPNFCELCEMFDEWKSKEVLSGTEKAWLDNPRGHPVYVKKKASQKASEYVQLGSSRRRSGSGFFSRGKSPARSADLRRESNFF